MKKLYKWNKTLFLLLFMILAGNWAWAQNSDSLTLRYDSTQIQVRGFDQNTIEDFKSDSDFDYGRGSTEELGFWGRFWSWIRDILSELWQGENSGGILRFLLYGLCFFVAVYVILRLLDVDVSKLFYKSQDGGLTMEGEIHEDIHQINFNSEIKQAISNNDYRKAIRLQYLFALKKLSDAQAIDWKVGKTNLEYLSEVTSPQLKPNFDKLSYYFSYTWYGNFPADEQVYVKMEKVSQHLDQALATSL